MKSKFRQQGIRWERMTERARVMQSSIATDEEAAQRWLESEGVIESFLEAVTARSPEIPNGVQLGEACLWLIVLLGCDPGGDGLKLCADLLEGATPVSLLAQEGRVRAFLQAALAEVARQAGQATSDELLTRDLTSSDLF